jgi:hypothetical protein
VEATRRTPPDTPGVAGWLLTHAHGKAANVLREALLRADPALTRAEAQARAEAALAPGHRDARLLDLPRHAIIALLKV